MHLHGDADAFEFAHDIDHLRIADVGDVFLEGHAENGHRRICAAALQQALHAFARHALAHAVVDAASGENDFGMIAGLFGAKRQVIRIDADAVPADQPRLEIQEIPFGRRCREHVAGIDAELMKDGGQFVHEGDIEIALRVFDDLGGFGDLDRRRAVDAGLDHRTIDVGDDIERPRVLRRNHFDDGFEAVLLVARIDPLRRIADGEIASRREA